MESPPSFSTHSEALPISEDSGLLITSGSFSSDSASGWQQIQSELQESDFDEKSLSFCESADTSERLCGDFFNTVKKGPGKAILTAIEPPPEFQDNPIPVNIDKCLSAVCVPPSVVYTDVDECVHKSVPSSLDIATTTSHVSPLYPKTLKPECLYERRQCLNHRFASPRLLHLSPGRANRPSSRSSLSSRLSSSHNSLVTQFQADDSSFITQAISHDTLSAKTSDITDMYNVPFDSDIYAMPVDMVKPDTYVRSKSSKPKSNKKRAKATVQNFTENPNMASDKNTKSKDGKTKEKSKRLSFPGSSSKKNVVDDDNGPLPLTLRDVRRYLHTVYSPGSCDPDCRNTFTDKNNTLIASVCIHSRRSYRNSGRAVLLTEVNENPKPVETNNNAFDFVAAFGLQAAAAAAKNKKSKDDKKKGKMSPVRVLSINLKQSFCNLFRWKKPVSEGAGEAAAGAASAGAGGASKTSPVMQVMHRALPPLPQLPHTSNAFRRSINDEETGTAFATSIRKVKDYGWYWGPLSVEAAEKILSDEPDGSFIVRDSSDDHYIFTLTFKLKGIRHVRIEHDQGNFCFGGCTMFKAQTIVEFIENAVETSRNGRYLFFLNLRPMLGPVRVQLLYPVSRFKRVQSLQHMCRFVVLKYVRRDLIGELPLPRRILDYLSSTHYYSEIVADI